MTYPPVSVAMSVYNGAAWLAPAIDSILAQSFGDFEFLIVDDGSTDESAGLLESYAARDSRVRILRQENRGLVASLNRLIGEAAAPLIARMDADDISLPGRFERQVAFLRRHPDFGVVGAWSDCIDESGSRRHGCADLPDSHESFLEAIRTGAPLLCHSAVMMRSALVRSAGGYRAVYRHCEDYDLWLRLSERTKILSLPERLIRYRHSSGQVSSRHVMEQQIGAAIAHLAHDERRAGRPDPTEGLDSLPPLESVDRLFGRPDAARAIRARVAPGIVHSPVALRGDGYRLLLDHVRDGGARDGLWRTVGRLLKIGEPARAAGLAYALAAG